MVPGFLVVISYMLERKPHFTTRYAAYKWLLLEMGSFYVLFKIRTLFSEKTKLSFAILFHEICILINEYKFLTFEKVSSHPSKLHLILSFVTPFSCVRRWRLIFFLRCLLPQISQSTC